MIELFGGTMTQETIHNMDSEAWKKATPERRAHWLRNQIAFAESKKVNGPLPGTGEYWLEQYRKKLARIEAKLSRVV
jgi:hypothetical protein